MKNEIEIPDGYEAKIVGNKVVLEPKESEDERIRKMLIEQMERWKKCAEDNNVEQDVKDASDAIAYLEKQKDEAQKQFNLGVQAGREEVMYEMEKKQMPAEWSEEDREDVELIAEHLDNLGNTAMAEFLRNLRPQPQRRDTYYDIIHDILATLKDMDFMKITPEHRVSLLNDIRVKCKNADECAAILDEPHWKPSEEHFQGLRRAIVKAEKGSDAWNSLTDLYEQLKKL